MKQSERRNIPMKSKDSLVIGPEMKASQGSQTECTTILFIVKSLAKGQKSEHGA